MITCLAAAVLIPWTSSIAEDIVVPFHLGDNAIIVDAEVNGKATSCMFDTGFSGAFVLDESINIGKATGSMMLRDFVGQFEAKTVNISTLKLGGAPLATKGLSVVQQPTAHMSLSYNRHTDGIMGLQVAEGYVLEINFEKLKMIFHPKSFDISSRQPDNKKTFMPKVLPIGMNAVEMRVTAKNGEKMTLALDTGNAFFATTHKDVLTRCGLWKEGQKASFMRTAWVASGPVPSWYQLMSDMNIYGVPVAKSIWSIIDLPSSSSEADGTVGFQFLKNFNIILDLERRRVWMENFSGETGNKPTADIGISVQFDEGDKRMVITNVTPNSPAEKAGIKPRDHLLGVDGKEMLNVGFRTAEKLLEGELGSKVTVSVSRGGVLRTIELSREYLINGY